jgi:hypothetical protein
MDSSTSQRPDLTVETRDDGRTLRLSSARLDEPCDIRLARPEVIRHLYAELGENLASAIAPVRDRRRVEAEEAGHALDMIAEAGLRFLMYALADPHGHLDDLVGALWVACPTWRNRQARTPLIHVVSDPDQYFPWELLPLFDPFGPAPARDQVELERSASRFPGFAAVVERRNPYRPMSTDSLDGWHRLPIRVVYDATFPGAQDEVAFFRARGDVFELRGPYPRDVTDPAAPSLAQQLSDPSLSLDGAVDDHPDQVVHFACHCEGGHHDAKTFAYRLADEQQRSMVILLDDLLLDLFRHGGRRGRAGRRAAKPLAFLNACGTATMDPASASTLLKPFHDNDNRGIIGTAANVPDRIAAVLSKYFYTCLMLERATVGEALHEAKWRLLQDRGSPLGLLYSMHAFSGLRIAPIPT